METRGTVLLVEDDPDIAALIRDALGEVGYRALITRTVADAREALAAFRVGLVLSDAFHPGPAADPWAALEPLTQAAHAVPAVICSARPAAEYADYAAHGFAAFLAKPFDLDELLALVASLLPGGVPAVLVGGPGSRGPVATGEDLGHAG